MATLTLLIFDSPYGSQRPVTALRYALAAQEQGHAVQIFLLQDGVFLAKKGQDPRPLSTAVPAAMPNCEMLLRAALVTGAQVKSCGTCAMERGVTSEELLPEVDIASMRDLVSWTVECDKVITF